MASAVEGELSVQRDLPDGIDHGGQSAMELSPTTQSTAVETLITSATTEKIGNGGIGWAGSLVGSQNPDNLGYRYSTPTKRYRVDGGGNGVNGGRGGGGGAGQREIPTNLQIQLKNRQGEELATTIDIPTSSSIDDLTALVHSLLEDESNGDIGDKKVPYSFYASVSKEVPKAEKPSTIQEDVEITHSLAELLQAHASISTEEVLTITYQPLAVLRVRPVSRCTDTVQGHTEAVLHVSFSPHGKWLASGGGDAVVRFWDVATATPKFSSSGRRSAQQRNKKGQPSTNYSHKNHVLCTSWSPDGSRFVSADKNGVLLVWDPDKGMVIGKPIQAHSKWITSLAWEPMHSISIEQASKINNSSTTETGENATKDRCVVCERLVTASKDGTASIWNIRTQQKLATLSGHSDSIESVVWGGESLIYTASRDRTIKVWNPDRAILVKTLAGHGHRINALALSNQYVCRTGPYDGRGRITQKMNGGALSTAASLIIAAKEKYTNFCQQQQGPAERLVSCSDDFTLFLWHPTAQGKHPVKRLTGHQQAVNHIAFSPDGRFLVSASFDKKIKVWNGLSGEYLYTCTGHVNAVYQVAWSPDSRYFVSASKDSTAKLWEIGSTGGATTTQSKQQRTAAKETLPGHADEVYALDWSPTGGCVATGSKDRTIKIWKH